MFDPNTFITDAIQSIKEKVKGKAIIACSGGIDSSVSAVLAGKALGKDLLAIFVDTGFMRKNEPEEVEDMFKNTGINFRSVNASDEYFEEVLAEYHKRRNTVYEAINKIPGALCPNPSGAFYVVARLPIDNSDKFCQWLLDSFHYENQTVMLAPATGFYSTPGRGLDEVRISYVLKVEDLRQSIKILGEALKVYPGRTR